MGRPNGPYSIDQKLFFINLVKDHKLTCNGVKRQYGINYHQVKRWIDQYDAQGETGLEPHSNKYYPKELKEDAVFEYLYSNQTLSQVAEKYHIVNSNLLSRWVSQYNNRNIDNTRRVPSMKDGRKTTLTERIEIVRWVIDHNLDYSGATQQFNVSYGQVYSWTRKYKKNGETALEDHRGQTQTDTGNLDEAARKDLEIKALQHQIEMLSTENAALKKLEQLERSDVLKKQPQSNGNIIPLRHFHKK